MLIMRSALREAIRRRAGQWQAFHEWKDNRTDSMTFEERIGWYNEAFLFVKSLPAAPQARDLDEKIGRVRSLHAHLKYLNLRHDV